MADSYVGQKRYYTTGGLDTSGVTLPSSSKVGNTNMWGAIIPAAASLIGSVVQGIGNRNSQENTNELNYRMFKEQNQWNLQQWNRENEYNSPAEQAKRLQAAGINPNFVFGNGSIAEAGRLESASPIAMQAPQMNVDYNAAANAVYTGINAYNQSQLVNAQTSELREKAHSLAIQNDLDFITMADKIKSLHLKPQVEQEYLDYMLQTHRARVAVSQGSERMQQEQIANLQENTNYIVAKRQIERDVADNQIKFNDAQIDYMAKALAQHQQEIEIAKGHLEQAQLNGQAQRAALGNEVIHMLTQDGFDWERVGISKEMMSSEKFKNYVGSLGSALVGAVAGYLSRGTSMVGASTPVVPTMPKAPFEYAPW